MKVASRKYEFSFTLHVLMLHVFAIRSNIAKYERTFFNTILIPMVTAIALTGHLPVINALSFSK